MPTLRPHHHRRLPEPHRGISPARCAWLAACLPADRFQDHSRSPASRGCSTCGTTCASTSSRARKRQRSPRSASASPRRCWGRRSSSKLWESESQRTLAHPVARRDGGGKPPRRRARPRAVGDRPPGRGPAHAGRAQPARPRRPRHGRRRPRSRSIWRPDECLRVLFVFAEARGSRPLGGTAGAAGVAAAL